MRRIMVTVVSILGLYGSGAAIAQDGSDFLSEVAVANTNTIVVGRMNDIAMQETVRGNGGATPNRQVPQNQSANMNFVASRARTKANLQIFVEKRKAENQAAGEQLEQLLASHDVIGTVQSVLGQYGLQRDNVAHAYTLYWIVYWGLANGVYEAPSVRSVQAVAQQVEQGFAVSPEFASMTEVQKQQTAEELMVLTAILDSASTQAKSDPSFAAQMEKASLQGSRKSGLQLDRIALTEEGFVPAQKRRGDASDAGSSEETSFAGVNAPTDAEGLSTTNLALIAAAGGAGLAGMFLLGKAMGRRG